LEAEFLVNRRIAIITDDPGWHGARLSKAFAARGCEALFVPLKSSHFDLACDPFAIKLPGFDAALPAAAFVRGVPGGSLEQVVFYLDVLHALTALGVPVYNDPRAIERSVDKGMTSFLLRRAGIPTPPTWITSDAEWAKAIAMRELATGHELVCKPLFGAQGVGLVRVQPGEALPPIENYHGIYYLQRYIDTGEGCWHDWRVFVIDGHAVAAMRRSGVTWISNIARGGRSRPTVLDKTLRSLAEAAVAATNMNYGGVDIIRDGAGQASVVEVNSIPAWKGLQSTCNVNVAELLVADFLRYCEADDIAEAAG
jgi:tetrahydromethanopterin:alpha-L-glutamate ligase